jgi:DNA-binding transcriptional regulator YiaG
MRAQLAALKKQVASVQRRMKAAAQATAAPERPTKAARPMRASAIRAMRTRLGITASQLAKLVWVSDQSIYNWEHEKARPKTAQAAALHELKGLGKCRVRERLAKQPYDEAGPAAGFQTAH